MKLREPTVEKKLISYSTKKPSTDEAIGKASSYPEDSGIYMVRAVNELGEAITTCVISVSGKRSIIYDTNNPEGLGRIQHLESHAIRGLQEIEDKASIPPTFLSN